MRILSPKNQAKLNDERIAKLKDRVAYSLELDQLDSEIWNKFYQYTELDSGCWEWQGAISSGRYGHMWCVDKNVYAHRISYALHYGPIPEGMLVLHKCDNTKCVNPDHLFLGTHQDNMDDCVNKRRIAHGSKNGQSKLNEEQVLEIKKELADSKDWHVVKTLAKKYGVHNTTIYKIRNGSTWSHIVYKGVDFNGKGQQG